jgi:hypothetical protein
MTVTVLQGAGRQVAVEDRWIRAKHREGKEFFAWCGRRSWCALFLKLASSKCWAIDDRPFLDIIIPIHKRNLAIAEVCLRSTSYLGFGKAISDRRARRASLI